jgi:HPt (histidine-containing phosphotransfer) domain-containing protein
VQDSLRVRGSAAGQLNRKRSPVYETGDTSTTQMSQRALAVRFLTRTQSEIAQLKACLPDEPMALEAPAVAQMERMAHKIASTAESFDFPQISAIAAAIELLAHDGRAKTMRERLLLMTRLTEQVLALEVYVEFALAERTVQDAAAGLPMSEYLPGFRARK